MRLINCTTYDLEEFEGEDLPNYAILSHTWGKEELSYKDIARSETWYRLKEATKVRRTCEMASTHGINYVWVDTCCIDKRSSAELTESINSMFKWYQLSAECLVYLSDYDKTESDDFSGCKWFTRGWTLQELIAPRRLSFYDRNWRLIMRKAADRTGAFAAQVPKITGIAADVFFGLPLKRVSVAARMSWIARRNTTRPEDIAYCVLGVFDINMPLLYGEGGQKAFLRLQEAIIKESNDMSIFAWEKPPGPPTGILAASPAYFSNSGDIVSHSPRVVGPEFGVTNKGIRIQTHIWRSYPAVQARWSAIYLYCYKNGGAMGVYVEPIGGVYVRVNVHELINFNQVESDPKSMEREELIYIRKMN